MWEVEQDTGTSSGVGPVDLPWPRMRRGRACAVARENSRTNQILKGWPGIWFKLRHGQCHVFVVEPKAGSRPLMNATWPTFFLEPLSAADARLWHRYCQP